MPEKIKKSWLVDNEDLLQWSSESSDRLVGQWWETSCPCRKSPTVPGGWSFVSCYRSSRLVDRRNLNAGLVSGTGVNGFAERQQRLAKTTTPSSPRALCKWKYSIGVTSKVSPVKFRGWFNIHALFLKNIRVDVPAQQTLRPSTSNSATCKLMRYLATAQLNQLFRVCTLIVINYIQPGTSYDDVTIIILSFQATGCLSAFKFITTSTSWRSTNDVRLSIVWRTIIAWSINLFLSLQVAVNNIIWNT